MLFPFIKPNIPRPDQWVEYLNESYDIGYFSNFGPLATRLAGEMADAYLVPNYDAVLCSSNTAGLVAVLNSLNLYGKRVALPDFTFAATVQAVFAAGAVPVICDVDSETWELCPKSLAKAFEKHSDIACVIHVRPFGLNRSIEATRRLCRSNRVPVVVDAAAGLGSPDTSKKFGSDDGEIEIFSLHATKVFAIGEGGLIVAPKNRIDAIKSALNFGFQADRTYTDGQNGKVDEFRAAIGLAMLRRMKEVVAVRQSHARFYKNLFSGYPGLQVATKPGPAPWSVYPVVFDKPVGSEIIEAFADNGIEIKKYYWPGVLNGYKGEREMLSVPTPNSAYIQQRCACFPVYSEFTPETAEKLKYSIERSFEALAAK